MYGLYSRGLRDLPTSAVDCILYEPADKRYNTDCVGLCSTNTVIHSRDTWKEFESLNEVGCDVGTNFDS
jgi:hypothetical protein